MAGPPVPSETRRRRWGAQRSHSKPNGTKVASVPTRLYREIGEVLEGVGRIYRTLRILDGRIMLTGYTGPSAS